MEAGSGLRGCDLDVSGDGGASWTHLLTETQATTYTFAGTLGVAYTFRVRATDNVNNASDWAQAEARTVVVKKYYSVAGQRIAMRANGVLYYLHTDHLGSTSLTTDETGAVVAEQRYLPYGEVRWVSGTLPTDLQFTGQRDETGLGLMDYRARFYSSRLGRFVSADSVVPGIGSLSLNRYMYVSGSPIRYNDPTGHMRPTDESGNYAPGNHYPGLPGWYEAGRAYQTYLKAKCDYAEHPDNENYARQLESAQAGFELFRNQARMAMPMTLWTEDNVASLYEGAGTVGIGMVSSLSGGPEDSGVGGIPESLRRDVLGDPDCVGCGYRGTKPTLPPSGKVWTGPRLPSDPSKPLTGEGWEGWEWRGKGEPGSGKGSWYNPSTEESLHPDQGHAPPIGPHFDYVAPDGSEWRVLLDGTMMPKE